MTITSNTSTITVSTIIQPSFKLYNDGLFLSTEEIQYTKTRLTTLPWSTHYNLLKTDAEGALNADLNSINNYFSDNHYNGFYGSSQDYNNGQKIRNKIRSLGMYYALTSVTNKDDYANKVISWIRKLLLDSTTRLDPYYTNHHYTYQSIIAGVLYGAQLTFTHSRWNSETISYEGISMSLRSALNKWCITTGNVFKNRSYNEGFSESRDYCVAICGMISGNTAMVNGVLNAWYDHIKPFIAPEGSIPPERGRQGSAGCSTGCTSPCGTIPASDMCCGISYGTLGVRHLITMAELMRHRNLDLYHKTLTVNGGTVTFEKILDWYARWTNKSKDWYCNNTTEYPYCSKPSKCFIGQSRDIFEFGYTMLSKKVTYKDSINFSGRSGGRNGVYDERVMGYVTLTHGSAFV